MVVFIAGDHVHIGNRRRYIGDCLRYSRKNFQTNPCLEELADKYCSNPTTELEQWPPTLSSISRTSYLEDGEFSYDIDYTFFYMYVSCPKAKLSESLGSERNETSVIPAENTGGKWLLLYFCAIA